MPKISVVMPAYNHEKYIGEAIESVLNQSFRDFEFIIINDGSTDNTENIIKKFDDPRINYISQENMDAPYTLNKAISLAKGNYISIINSDDVYHKDRLDSLLKVIETKNLDFLFTNIEFIDANSSKLFNPMDFNISWIKRLNTLYSNTKSLKQTLLFGNLAATSSNFFFKTEVLDKVGNFCDNRYTHDYEYLLRCLLTLDENVYYLDQNKLLYYRLHTTNTIREKSKIPRTEIYKLLTEYGPKFLEDPKNIENATIALNYLQKFNDSITSDVTRLENSFFGKFTELIRIIGKSIIGRSVIEKEL